jgi:hypothetical protein
VLGVFGVSALLLKDPPLGARGANMGFPADSLPLSLLYCSGDVARAVAADFSVPTETSGAKPVLAREKDEDTSDSAVLVRSSRSELRASRGVSVSRCWIFSVKWSC